MEKIGRRQWIDGKLAAPVDEATRFYTVDKTQFFEETIGEHDISKYQQGMQDIISRYDIKNKRILCIGAGQCWYEYWFSNDNNQILFVDIDEKEVIEPMLKKLPANASGSEENIHYAIADVRNLGEYLSEPYDVILSFGFTPDEFYRCEVQKNSPNDTNYSWELYKQTFSDLILFITKQLPENGLLVSLSYHGGPDVTSPTYLNSVSSTCTENQMTLLEVTAMQDCPGANLVVARKGLKQEPWSTQPLPELSAIHPRAEYRPNSLPVFSLLPCSDYSAFGKNEEIMNQIVKQNFSDIKTCLYNGHHSREVRSMLLAKIDVTSLESTSSKNEFKIFPNSGAFKLSTLGSLPSKEQFDLFWMSSCERDNKFRISTIKSYAKSIPDGSDVVFSPETHEILRSINTKQIVITGLAGQGVTQSSQFVRQMSRELKRHKFTAHKLYTLKNASNVFFVYGTKEGVAANKNFNINEFYPNAENPEAIEVNLKPFLVPIYLKKLESQLRTIARGIRDLIK